MDGLPEWIAFDGIIRDKDFTNAGDITPGLPPSSCHLHASSLSGAGVHPSSVNITGVVKPYSSENHGHHVNHARRKAILRGNGRAGFLVVANDRDEERNMATDPICFSESSPKQGPSHPLFKSGQLSDTWLNAGGLQKDDLLQPGGEMIAHGRKVQFLQQENNLQYCGHSLLPYSKHHQPSGWPASNFPSNESSSSQPHEHTAQDMLSCTASLDSAQLAAQGKSPFHFLEDKSAAYAGIGSSLPEHQVDQAAPQYGSQLALERVSSAPVPILQEGFHGHAFEDFDDGFAAGLWSSHPQQGILMDSMQVDGSQNEAGHESELLAIAALPGSSYMAMVTGEKDIRDADCTHLGAQLPLFDGKSSVAAGGGGDDDDPKKTEVEPEAKSVPNMSFILEAAQELLMEVCRCPIPSRKWRRRHDGSSFGDGTGQRPSPVSSSVCGVSGHGQLQTIPIGGTREQAQRLRALLVDVEKSYGKYKEQNTTLAAAFDAAAGTDGSANMYTKPSLHAISAAYRSAKDIGGNKSGSGGTTRFDRLLILLDTGEAATTRDTAARQIGELASLHRSDLHALIRRVKRLLKSSKWDTRVAAAKALGYIARNTPHPTVQDLQTAASTVSGDEGALAARNGTASAAPDGEGAAPAAAGNAAAGGGLCFEGDEDLEAPAQAAAAPATGSSNPAAGAGGKQKQKREATAGIKRGAQDLMAEMLPSGPSPGVGDGGNSAGVSPALSKSLSARERNMLKRKAKSMSKGKKGGGAHGGVGEVDEDEDGEEGERGGRKKMRTKSVVSDGKEGNKITVEQVAAEGDDWEEEEEEEGEWPLLALCEQLLTDMFHPVWEVRHGSILALREVMSAHGNSAAVCRPIVPSKWASANGNEEREDEKGKMELEVVKEEDDGKTVPEMREPDVALVKAPIVRSEKEEEGVNKEMEGGPEASVTNKEGVINQNSGGRARMGLDLHLSDGMQSEEIGEGSVRNLGNEGSIEESKVEAKTDRSEEKSKCEESEKAVGKVLDLNMEVSEEANEGKPVDEGEVAEEKSGEEKESALVVAQPVRLAEKGGTPTMESARKAQLAIEVARKAQADNELFLEDCAIRLLCIFALDRLEDFVSDQVVAPVREACGQALGVVLKYLPSRAVARTLDVLLQMQNRSEWEVRHGALLGIKYLIAVRQELLPSLLPSLLPACIRALQDSDDDVRAVAAEALLPAAKTVGEGVDESDLRQLMRLLWGILSELDDLSPSTSSVMTLLAALHALPRVAALWSVSPSVDASADAKPAAAAAAAASAGGQVEDDEELGEDEDLDDKEEEENLAIDGIKPKSNKDAAAGTAAVGAGRDSLPPLVVLVRRLWPLMRHTISAVRLAAVSTL
ncbi:unnamed protein product, partial [Closterium sp. NIES-54]